MLKTVGQTDSSIENGTLNATSWGDEVSRFAMLPRDIHGSYDMRNSSDQALASALERYNSLQREA